MFKKLILVGFIFLFLGFKLALATEVIPIISYTFNGTSSNIVANPVVNPVEIKFSASENIPNWVSIKIEKTDDSSIYKTFSPNSCDSTAYCTETWNGAISPKNKVLVDGIYNIFVHVKKDVASPVTYDFILTSPYTITVDSSISTSDEILTPNVIPISEPIVTPEPKTKIVETPKIKTQIIGKTLGFVGLPLSLDTMTLGLSGEQLRYGKYFWNFGDGDSKEIQVMNSQQFTHTYFYPGDYVVSLDYYQNYYSDNPDASNQITIKIIGVDISISRVGDEKDFFVELTNNTDYNADISNWILASDSKSFIIPRNTILAPKKKMIISPKITNFSILDKDTLKLMTPQREIVFNYLSSIIVPKIVPVSVSKTPTLILPRSSGEMPKTEGVNDNLLASTVSSETVNNDSVKSSNFPIIPLASFIFIGASAGAVYFIRQKKVVSEDVNDFEILDE